MLAWITGYTVSKNTPSSILEVSSLLGLVLAAEEALQGETVCLFLCVVVLLSYLGIVLWNEFIVARVVVLTSIGIANRILTVMSLRDLKIYNVYMDVRLVFYMNYNCVWIWGEQPLFFALHKLYSTEYFDLPFWYFFQKKTPLKILK